MNSCFSIQGQYALVTGASSGLGADLARAFVQAGCDVALLARKVDRLQILREELLRIGEKEGRELRLPVVPCDVASLPACEEAVRQIVEIFPRIDILVNNAGIAIGGTVTGMEESAWEKMLAVNLQGAIHLSKLVIPLMQKAHYGRIVNISSISAQVADKSGPYLRHAYVTTKTALVGLTRAMAATYAAEGLSINAVAPGLYPSAMTRRSLLQDEAYLSAYCSRCPAGRPAEVGEVDGAVLFLASPAASYVQGQLLAVDGGYSLV